MGNFLDTVTTPQQHGNLPATPWTVKSRECEFDDDGVDWDTARVVLTGRFASYEQAVAAVPARQTVATGYMPQGTWFFSGAELVRKVGELFHCRMSIKGIAEDMASDRPVWVRTNARPQSYSLSNFSAAGPAGGAATIWKAVNVVDNTLEVTKVYFTTDEAPTSLVGKAATVMAGHGQTAFPTPPTSVFAAAILTEPTLNIPWGWVLEAAESERVGPVSGGLRRVELTYYYQNAITP